MAYLMRQSQLRYFRRYTAVVIHESYDTGIEGSLSGLIQTGHGLGISLELLTDTAGRAGRGSDPGEPECTAGEISVDIEITFTNKFQIDTKYSVVFHYFDYL